LVLASGLVLAPAIASAGDVDDAATALVSDLALPSVEALSLRDDIGIVVQLDGDLSRLVGGLLLARLHALGADSAFAIEPGSNSDERARSAGAEWLLCVRGEAKDGVLSLFAELRRIDRGIWSAPPDPNATMIVATAEHRSSLAALPQPTDPPPPPPADRPRLEGPALRIQSLAEPVLALRACRISEPEADDLVVLTPSALAIYSLREGTIRRIAAVELADLPRHPTPVRDPIGAIACSGKRIAFGHSGLAEGRIVEARSLKGTIVLEPSGTLDGIPIAALPKERWLLGKTEAGLSRYGRELRALAGSKVSKVMLDAPIVDAVALDGDAPDGWRLLAVTSDYQIVRFGDRLAGPERVAPSGVGISAFVLDGRPHVITTSAARDGGDGLALLSEGEPSHPVPVEGLVFATAVGRFRGPGLDLIAASRTGDRTDLLVLRLWEPR
jgi:hypothetical protein